MSLHAVALPAARFVATAAAAVLLAIVLAWWGWQGFGPRTASVVPATPKDPAATILASGLWQGSAVAPAPDAPPAEATTLSGDARLVGVIAEREGRGYALFRLPTGPRLVAVGEEIAQGATLVAVQADAVTIREGARERRVDLRVVAAAKPAPALATAPPVASRRSAACTPPAGFRGAVLRLNAELFQGIIAKPEAWTALLASDRTGLVVRGDSGFSAMLAMRKGDRLMQANGIALTAPDDVVTAVLRPLVGQQAVRVTGARNGQPREWLLLNAGSCPP